MPPLSKTLFTVNTFYQAPDHILLFQSLSNGYQIYDGWYTTNITEIVGTYFEMVMCWKIQLLLRFKWQSTFALMLHSLSTPQPFNSAILCASSHAISVLISTIIVAACHISKPNYSTFCQFGRSVLKYPYCILNFPNPLYLQCTQWYTSSLYH